MPKELVVQPVSSELGRQRSDEMGRHGNGLRVWCASPCSWNACVGGSREVSFALRVGVEPAARLCSGIEESRGKKGASNGRWTNPASRPGGQPEEAT